MKKDLTIDLNNSDFFAYNFVSQSKKNPKKGTEKIKFSDKTADEIICCVADRIKKVLGFNE